MLKNIKQWVHDNPKQARVLLVAIAGVLQTLVGPKLDLTQLQHLAEGLLLGWAVMPRPGDRVQKLPDVLVGP